MNARYLQLAETISVSIRNGKLAPGARLPTHRAFAEKFGVALATATRVYGELERRGLVVGETGRGTFVRDPEVSPTLGVRQTASDELIDLVFNMPGGAGDADMLREGLRRLASTGDLEAMLRYQPHGGRLHERKIIARDLARSIGKVDPECLLVTSGGQHGLAITALGHFKHGDAVAVDPLIYPGFKSLAALQGFDLVPVDGANGVMDADELDRQCGARKLRGVYLMPTVQNPLGSVMKEATRHKLIEVARRHDLLIVEDSAYAFLEPDPPPTFVALAPERTIHVGSFSKSLATGLRLGYQIVPEHLVDRSLEAIRATTWNAPALVSGLVAAWIEDGTLLSSESHRRREGARRQELCREIMAGLPLHSHHNAGFVWLPLPDALRADPIISRLKSRGISISNAAGFATTTAVPQALRLAFGGLKKSDMMEGFKAVREEVDSAALGYRDRY